ncbi:hypothetical protein C7R92_26755 [Brevibacillus porteri]|uniref:Uncharacterized protein n=1 Tax=Brevibacillus porteri TaxID=2126350 RepID=A0ABX5FHU4_9BACL|nr:hypothetical protein C7R92_26755 [Brevibacillus porteri]
MMFGNAKATSALDSGNQVFLESSNVSLIMNRFILKLDFNIFRLYSLSSKLTKKVLVSVPTRSVISDWLKYGKAFFI